MENELRLGNLVNYAGKLHFVDYADIELLARKVDMEEVMDYEPIPLTEELLVNFEEVEKLVFDSEETGYGTEYHIKINKDFIINIKEDMSFCIESIKYPNNSVELDNDYLETVHFLQNLYNVLSKGKELKINDSL
jgi:hypothetical protein